MFGHFKRKNKINSADNQNVDIKAAGIQGSAIVFHEKGIIDVTNFDKLDGYLTGCTIFALSDGTVRVCEYENENAIMEIIAISNIISFNDNINDCDPEHVTEVSLRTGSQEFRFVFDTVEIKKQFSYTFLTLLKNESGQPPVTLQLD